MTLFDDEKLWRVHYLPSMFKLVTRLQALLSNRFVLVNLLRLILRARDRPATILELMLVCCTLPGPLLIIVKFIDLLESSAFGLVNEKVDKDDRDPAEGALYKIC